jgi:putative ABC transport system permease protein
MATLGRKPDSVLVSSETVRDFQLVPGDQITLRLQDGQTKQYTDVPFHYVGVANEFPTAPSDSFLVANAAYVASATGSDAVGAFLVDTGGHDPASVARSVRQALGATVAVNDIVSSRKVIGSSLTAVDLAGLTKIELGFGLALVASATGLVVWLGLVERSRTFAIASALGASRRQLGGFVWGEALFITAGGLVAGAAAGWALSAMLVTALRGVFDPAPSGLTIPWGYLAVVGAIGLTGVVAAVEATITAGHRSSVQILRTL